MQIIEDKVYAFSKDNPPCYTAQPGEVLQFNTLDCFSGRLTDETVTMKDMDFSYNITNPAAGPVYVEEAEVGDVLVVEESLKYATVLVSIAPIMCVYPFLQKYFVKGVMIGAVKG